jgi:hypothetical protein
MFSSPYSACPYSPLPSVVSSNRYVSDAAAAAKVAVQDGYMRSFTQSKSPMYLKWCAIPTVERRVNAETGDVEQTDADFEYDPNVVGKEVRQQKLEAMKKKAQAVGIKAQVQAAELRAVAVSWLDTYESSSMDSVPGARHSAANGASAYDPTGGVYIKVTWEQHMKLWGLVPTEAQVEDGAEPHINEAPYFSHHDHLTSFVFRMPGGKWGVAGHAALEYSMTPDANDAKLLAKDYSPKVVSDVISYSPLGGDGIYEYAEGTDLAGNPHFMANTEVPRVFTLAAADASTIERYSAAREAERSVAPNARALEVRGALAEMHRLSVIWLPLVDAAGDTVLFNDFPVFEQTGGIEEKYIVLSLLEGARWVVVGAAWVQAGDTRERSLQESTAAKTGAPSYSPIGEYIESKSLRRAGCAVSSASLAQGEEVEQHCMVVSIARGDDAEAAIALRARIVREQATARSLGGVRLSLDESELVQIPEVAEFAGTYEKSMAGSTVVWRTETLGNDIAIDRDNTRITRTSSSSWGSHVTNSFTESQVRCPFPALRRCCLSVCYLFSIVLRSVFGLLFAVSLTAHPPSNSRLRFIALSARVVRT